MRIADILYFSPSFKFEDIDFADKERTIEAFKDRMYGFYLSPAKRLLDSNDAFASGLICTSVIDILARYMIGIDEVGKRITKWIIENVDGFDHEGAFNDDNYKNTIAYKFYSRFRNGLVHEGRIKELGQFSFEYQHILKVYDEAIIVNPKILLDQLMEIFNNFCDELLANEDKYNRFQSMLEEDFTQELSA